MLAISDNPGVPKPQASGAASVRRDLTSLQSWGGSGFKMLLRAGGVFKPLWGMPHMSFSADYLLRRIDGVLDLCWLRAEPVPLYSHSGCP